MNRFWSIVFDMRTLSVIGIVALVAFLFLGASAIEVGLIYAGIALAVILLIWLLVWAFKRWRARRASKALEKAIDEDVEDARKFTPGKNQAEFDAIRSRMGEAVKTIKTSKLGQTTGRSALYELPWYMVIGNPAAGKSTAVVKSGLKFPLCRQRGQYHPGHRWHPQLRLVLHHRRHPAGHGRSLLGCMKRTAANGWPFCRCSRSTAARHPSTA